MKIVIIGGGAAGMMCAATIKENNRRMDVLLLEKNDALGKKVMISGGGRCNITTGLQDIKIVLMKYPRGGKFLNSAMHKFSPKDTYDWFESHGVPLKCGEDMRVFPGSDKGKDVVEVFENIFNNDGVKIKYKTSVKSITKNKEGFVLECSNKEVITADKVVLALGGQACRQTGSSGDGYSLAENLGHTITKLAPSLSSLITKELWTSDLAGISITKAKLRVVGQKKISFTGPFLFTHWGISGPAVFALSSLIAYEKFDKQKPLIIEIDLIPDTQTNEVVNKFKEFTNLNPKKQFKYNIHQFVVVSVAEQIIRLAGIKDNVSNSNVSNKEFLLVAKLLKSLPINLVGRRPGDEFVTAGGINLVEINQHTMESKKCPGLYIAGEILDVDGFTGGFNLQAAWATGYLAGKSIAQEL